MSPWDAVSAVGAVATILVIIGFTWGFLDAIVSTMRKGK